MKDRPGDEAKRTALREALKQQIEAAEKEGDQVRAKQEDAYRNQGADPRGRVC